MAKKTCPNGHIYDTDIYGDNCPFCPSAAGSATSKTVINNPQFGGGGGSWAPTRATVANAGGAQGAGSEARTVLNNYGGGSDAPTIVAGQKNNPDNEPAGGTRIRVSGGDDKQKGRRLVGILVSYNTNPLGQSFNVYEGRNLVGSAPSCDAVIDNDDEVSRKHLTILYRTVDQKFRFKDEMSTNGTFVNGTPADEGELNDHDILLLGNTYLVFMAIPPMPVGKSSDQTASNR
jgi:hypothetical protein